MPSPPGGGEWFKCADHVGRYLEGCDQITTQLANFFPEYAALLPWHLNHMRAGCEHQRATWNTDEKIEVVTYKLTTEALMKQGKLKDKSLAELGEGAPVQWTLDQRAMMALPYTTTQAPDADSPGSGMYDVEKRETSFAGQVYPKEHPKGLLMKPCEVCGYKYGSAWLKEELPAEIIALAKSVGVKS